MRVARNPEVRSYLVEAKVALRTELYLSCIITSGTLAELVLREISLDHNSSVATICKKFYERGILNKEEFTNFYNLRKIRNQYARAVGQETSQ